MSTPIVQTTALGTTAASLRHDGTTYTYIIDDCGHRFFGIGFPRYIPDLAAHNRQRGRIRARLRRLALAAANG